MPVVRDPSKPRGLALMLGWRRLVVVLCGTSPIALLLSPGWRGGFPVVFARAAVIGFSALLAFGVLERWPTRLPRGIARWVLQVVAVALAVPISASALYIATTPTGAPPFWQVKESLTGFMYLSVLGVTLAPWIALGALVLQKDALARHQALAFDLARSELERQALDARLHLLQAQVAPHFLFNALANVQALVDAKSPRASAVLRTLTAYLRAAVPRLDEPVTTLGHELQLAEAYLRLMQLRMPDRLAFALHVDDAARGLRCPSVTLLTLVENAVRHGIDPSEEGGRIDIHVQRTGDRCTVRVVDTGLGLGTGASGLGTGLSTLRERLELLFGDAAQLHVRPQSPRGVCAELDLPAVEAAR
jgi:Histidine kinase